MTSRREFLGKVEIGLVVSPKYTLAGVRTDLKKVRIGEKIGSNAAGFQHKANIVETYKQPMWWQTDMLPEPLGHNRGHDGSHTFITHEFIDSIIHNRQPKVNVYEVLAFILHMVSWTISQHLKEANICVYRILTTKLIPTKY